MPILPGQRPGEVAMIGRSLMDMDKEQALKQIDAGKREFVGKLITTTAFAAPVVASFSMTALSNAEAQIANGSLKG
jgi:hypothetical protein